MYRHKKTSLTLSPFIEKPGKWTFFIFDLCGIVVFHFMTNCFQYFQNIFVYNNRYPDLLKAFGSNYRAAIDHYLRYHHTEHRIGLLFTNNHEYDGRWTVNSNDIYLSGSRRTGGAIDSLSWNNKEFINSRDHGRQMQMACNTNKYTECYNPTEAGGLCDSTHTTTHTHIDWIHVNNNVLTSQVRTTTVTLLHYLTWYQYWYEFTPESKNYMTK